jgi:hypothetical protein
MNMDDTMVGVCIAGGTAVFALTALINKNILAGIGLLAASALQLAIVFGGF